MTQTSVNHRTDQPTLPRFQAKAKADTGFLSGTVVMAQRGECPVEDLAKGDKIITRDRGFVLVRGVKRTTCRCRAISFAAGSLGDTRPDQDLVLPAGQKVLIRDWRAQALFNADRAMVRADALLDGEFIRDLGIREMVLYQIAFDAPHVLYAGGLELAAEPSGAAMSHAA
ncbi:Hint domain-containing protein [Ruegeria sp. 2205SS24-7]|uniref:Hint domain-containing protein n=1 Tax=Ruegeria discodermiae TaxID=3064389 RepID=UPI0027407F6F|nr:Hint domain-containing protein [Ruegeria sp. 2205SS24-7]MDP5215905.1 Hint domain-containing protein [Ruegeria sp. 2205SS24-7]